MKDDQKFDVVDLIAKSRFAEKDKDEDGKVTAAEFLAVCLGDEGFSKMLPNNAIYIFMVEKAADRHGRNC